MHYFNLKLSEDTLLFRPTLAEQAHWTAATTTIPTPLLTRDTITNFSEEEDQPCHLQIVERYPSQFLNLQTLATRLNPPPSTTVIHTEIKSLQCPCRTVLRAVPDSILGIRTICCYNQATKLNRRAHSLETENPTGFGFLPTKVVEVPRRRLTCAIVRCPHITFRYLKEQLICEGIIRFSCINDHFMLLLNYKAGPKRRITVSY